MLRIFVAALAVVLCGLCIFGSACATTGSASVPATNPLTPVTSHFWCGEHCSLAAGCEEGMICGCVKFYEVKELQTRKEAETELVSAVVLELVKREPGLTAGALLQKPHEIREVYGVFNNLKLVCGVFTRFGQ